MRKADVSTRTIQKTLVLSLLAHLLLLRYLTIVFIPDPVAHKPYFVFLGSFLDTHDVTSFEKPPVDPAQNLLTVPFEPSKDPFSLLDQRGQKPVYGIIQKPNNKVFLKTNFLKKEAPVDRDFLKSLGVDVQPPTYKPLKFKSQ